MNGQVRIIQMPTGFVPETPRYIHLHRDLRVTADTVAQVQDQIYKPAVFGPGTWWVSHTDSFAVSSFEERMIFIKNFKNRIDKLPCLNCREHAKQYMASVPIEKYFMDPPEQYLRVYPTAVGLGLAFYVWMFHNTVNEKLGKMKITWEECVRMYTTDAHTCDKECGKTE